jgi:DNA invertase Pin-like site-specific DNA recombinase
VEADRKKRLEDTWAEIDALLADAHAALPRRKAKTLGAIYARYSTDSQDSIADQIRGCLEVAVRESIFVLREHIFIDLGVRGAKERRPGLVALKAALAAKAVGVLYVFTTNRLYRKAYKSMKFVEEEIVARGIRCYFIKSGIDTAADERWRLPLQVHAMIDEMGAGMYAENIRAGHEGLFLRRWVTGTLSLGYTGQDVDGPKTKRGESRQEIVIDPETAPWVVKIFTWFVRDGLSIGEIIRRLNGDTDAPLPPMAASGRWTRLAVIGILRNPRYRGYWTYGAMKSVWQNTADYARQFPRDKPLREAQFEELRIIDDATWYAAQQRLATLRPESGRPHKSADRKRRPNLLNGLLECQAHGRRIQTGGGYGDFFICPICHDMPAEERPLYSHLNRDLAHRLTLEKLAQLVRADTGFVADVIGALRAEVDAAGRPDPDQVAQLKRRKERLSNQIQFLLQNAGETDEDRRETGHELSRLRVERADVDVALEQATRRSQPPAVPSEGDVNSMLDDLAGILAKAVEGEQEDAAAARQLIEALTGGRIVVEQQGERKPQQGWVRGHFRLRLLEYVCGRFGAAAPAGEAVEVVIDFRKPSAAAERADRVKALYDEGWSMTAIAKRLGSNINSVRKALVAWYEQRGLPVPDNRSRRNARPAPDGWRPKYQVIEPEVMKLVDEGLLLHEIAERLGYDRTTVKKAMEYGYAARGLTAPDGRARRKALRLAREANGDGPAPAADDVDDRGEPGDCAAPAA